MRKKLVATFLAVGLLVTSVPMSGVNAFEGDSFEKDKYFASVARNRGYIQPELDLSYLNDSYANLPMTYAELPEKYDLRTEGRISPVRNQYFQDCWAIATNDAAGSSAMRQFPLLELSPEHTAKFAYTGEYEQESWPGFFGVDPSEDPYNSGGFSSISLGTMASWKGPVTRDTLGFEYSPEAPVIPDELRNASDFHLQDAVYFPVGIFFEDSYHGNYPEITKTLILTEGAASASFFTGDDKLSLKDDLNWYHKNESPGDHEISIVGWDDNYPKENFSYAGEQPANDGAWLIRNSWGTNTGKDGYQWLSYEDKTIGVSSSYLLEDKNNYKNIYQYDILGWSLLYGCKDENGNVAPTGKAANIFTATENEMLEAVSFYTTDAASEYSISVYTDVEDGIPENESVQLSNMTGTEMYAGYHTIELDTPVYLEKGTNFSIVLELKNPSETYQIAVEAALWKSEEEPQYMGKGRSYIFDPYEGGWYPIAGKINNVYVSSACIKGFTNPVPEEVGVEESVAENAADPANTNVEDKDKIMPALVSTVRFSNEYGPIMEGPAKDGEQITLTSSGADGIIYKMGDGPEIKQDVTSDSPETDITIDFPDGVDNITITACGYKNGEVDGEVLRGREITKTFTKADALLTDLSVNLGDGYNHLNVKDIEGTVHEYGETVYSANTESIVISAQSIDNITINGETYNKSVDGIANYQEYALNDGYNNFEIKVSGDGDSKISHTYKFSVYRTSLEIDYRNEKVIFNENEDKVYVNYNDEEIELKSGDSISEYVNGSYQVFDIKDKNGVLHSIPVYGRFVDGSGIKINYSTEETLQNFSKYWKSSINPDMSEAADHEEGSFKLTPGQDLYVQREATDTAFKSNIIRIEVPKRPEKPDVEVEEITLNSVKLTQLDGVMYGIDYVSESSSSLIENLEPDTEYVVKVYYSSTNNSFKSDVAEVKIKTLSDKPEPDKPEPDKPEPDKPQMDHVILDGKDQSIDLSNGGEFRVRIEGSPEDLTSVYVDNKLVDKRNYTVEKGSIVVIFTDEYTRTLSKGTHSLSFEFTNGQTIDTTFTVTNAFDGNDKATVDNNKPETGDSQSFIGVWIASAVGTLIVLIVAVAVIIGMRRNKKK